MNGLISLNGDQLRKLKNMNKAVIFDSTFVSFVLSAIFGDEVLKIGSTTDLLNNAHAQLDQNKLSFIRGIYLGPYSLAELIYTYNISKIINDFHFFPSDLFVERVGGDKSRQSSFQRLVNKKCINIGRRSRQ